MNRLSYLFTEVSNTFVIVTAHKQVCANPQEDEEFKQMKRMKKVKVKKMRFKK